jgi:hypothetical protein
VMQLIVAWALVPVRWDQLPIENWRRHAYALSRPSCPGRPPLSGSARNLFFPGQARNDQQWRQRHERPPVGARLASPLSGPTECSDPGTGNATSRGHGPHHWATPRDSRMSPRFVDGGRAMRRQPLDLLGLGDLHIPAGQLQMVVHVAGAIHRLDGSVHDIPQGPPWACCRHLACHREVPLHGIRPYARRAATFLRPQPDVWLFQVRARHPSAAPRPCMWRSGPIRQCAAVVRRGHSAQTGTPLSVSCPPVGAPFGE